MRIPKIIKNICAGFIDFDHGMNEYEIYFTIPHGKNNYIFTIKRPDIGRPHFRVYRNRISIFTYHCSIELFDAWYYKYSNIFSYEKILRSLFRCKKLPDLVVRQMEMVMTSNYKDSSVSCWDVMVDDWFNLNVSSGIECNETIPDYINNLNDYTGYLSTFQDQILVINGWIESKRNKKKGVK